MAGLAIHHINGPVNVLRLEGQLKGITKVLYLFLDFHLSPNEQSECTNIFNMDIQQYLATNFYQLNEQKNTYDFFLEIYPYETINNLSDENVSIKEGYIEEVVRFFKKVFAYNQTTRKVKMSQLFNNVRFHYLDLRDYFFHSTDRHLQTMMIIAHQLMRDDYLNVYQLQRIVDKMAVVISYIKYIIKTLAKNYFNIKTTPRIIKHQSVDTDKQVIEYLVNKIKYDYHHSTVKTILQQLLHAIKQSFKKILQQMITVNQRFQSYIELLLNTDNQLTADRNRQEVFSYGLASVTKRTIILDIVNSVSTIYLEGLIDIFARLTDVYFLRRFLDKDYITHAIVYSGASHSVLYIHYLVTYFQFKVTHASYSKITDMSELTKQIEQEPLNNINQFILPSHLTQCSSMEHFPANFK